MAKQKRRENGNMKRDAGWRNCPGAARPEMEFNLCCGRALIDPVAKERMRVLIQSGVELARRLRPSRSGNDCRLLLMRRFQARRKT